MRKLAALPNVSCKLSGLLNEAPPQADAATLGGNAIRDYRLDEETLP